MSLSTIAVLALVISGNNVGHVNSQGMQISISYTVFDNMELCEQARPMLEANASAKIAKFTGEEWPAPEIKLESECFTRAITRD